MMLTKKTKEKISREAIKLAARLKKSVENVKRLPKPLLRSLMFKAMTGAQKKNDWNPHRP